MKRHAGQWQNHSALLQDDVTARLIVFPPCGTKRRRLLLRLYASIELDAVTATPLLADVIITTTAGRLLREFFEIWWHGCCYIDCADAASASTYAR